MPCGASQSLYLPYQIENVGFGQHDDIVFVDEDDIVSGKYSAPIGRKALFDPFDPRGMYPDDRKPKSAFGSPGQLFRNGERSPAVLVSDGLPLKGRRDCVRTFDRIQFQIPEKRSSVDGFSR